MPTLYPFLRRKNKVIYLEVFPVIKKHEMSQRENKVVVTVWKQKKGLFAEQPTD